MRLTGDERRATIVAAARTEFARHGFHGVSTASIATRAGCSEPMLYKHFAGKHGLFLAALEDSIRLFQEWFDEQVTTHVEVDAIQLARSVITAQLHNEQFGELMRLRMLAVSLAEDEDVRAALTALDTETSARIGTLLDRAIAQGRVRQGTDPAFVTWSWFGYMLAASYREALQPGTFTEMVPVVERFLDSLAPGD